MKKKATIITVIACVLSFVMAFALAACGDDKDDGTVTVTGIEIMQTATIEETRTQNVIVAITYSDGSTKKSDSSLTWNSDNESVATVTRGIVSGKAKGTANITASVGGVTSNTCAVTVTAGREVTIYNASGAAITELTVDKEDDPVALTAKVTREGTELSDQTIIWESSDTAKASVSAEGVVTALSDTAEGEPIAITATVEGTSFKATLALTITWANKSNYTFDASTYEQNKSPAGIWNYWGDKNYNWTNTEITAAYVDPTYEENHTAAEGFEYIGANKVTIEFKVDDPTVNVASVQLFYRSAGEAEAAKLLTNHNYELTLKLDSSVAGEVSLNDFTKMSGAAVAGTEVGEITLKEETEEAETQAEEGEEGEEEEILYKNYTFDIVAGTNTLTVQFRHGDTGAIFANGVYDNIESAIQLCLGKLAGDHVVVSVYDIQYKDLGEAEVKWTDDVTKLDGYEPPAPEGTEGETFEAVYTESNNDGDTLTAKDTWAVWYVQDAGWGCGAVVTMDVTLNAEDKSCTLAYNANGNENNWGVQLRYMPTEVEAGKTYKVRLKINSTVAYSFTLGGKTVALEVGDNDVEFYWTAGTCVLEGNICKAGSDEDITLVISNLTWTEIIPAE